MKMQKPIILQFWTWYYTTAVKGLIHIWKNFIIFIKQYYSIPLLLKTLFYPWRRDITKYRRGFSFKFFFETLSFNLISRSIGFIVRFFAVITGVICLLAVIILGILALIIWIVLPVVLLLLIIIGLLFLFG